MVRGRSTYWRRRAFRHLFLGGASVLLTAGIYSLLARKDPIHDISLASAYTALLLFGVCLAMGPLNVLRGRPNPVSSGLRRDTGIWAGIVGLFHLAVGVNVHLRGRPWLYFVYPADQSHAVPVRHDLFGFSNYTGLIAGFILILLLTLSNDRSLVRLGTRRWKALQRLNYYAAALIVAHSVGYQFIEARVHLPLLLAIFIIIAAGVGALQLAGYLKVRRKGKGAEARRASVMSGSV